MDRRLLLMLLLGGGQDDAPAPAFPDASNTGSAAGLPAYGGSSTINAPTTIENVKITGTLTINSGGAGSIIRNVEIDCTGTGNIYGVDASAADLTFEDVTITGAGLGDDENTTGLSLGGSTNFTILRVNISGFENGITDGVSGTIDDSYIHDLNTAKVDPHYDGLAHQGGQNGVTVTHNTFIVQGAVYFAKGDFGTVTNVTLHNNYFGWQADAGPYTIHGTNSADDVINLVVTDNHIEDGTDGYYSWDFSPMMTGNVDADTGAYITSIYEPYITASGATQPVYASSTSPSTLYYNGKTYVFWETYDRVADKRWTCVRAYTHATGLWGRIYNVGPHSDASAGDDDDHGVPSAAVNADGRIVVAWGDHDGTFHLATSTNVGDESLWTTLTNGFTTGPYTYPHPVLIGTTMHFVFRKDIPPGGTYAAGAKILVTRPVTWSGATATVGTEVEIANFGNDSRWYQGNAELVSGRIAQAAARADYGDTFRRDVYYYEIDLANSRLQAFGGTTVAFPVGLTDMNTTFRVRTTAGGSNLQAAHLHIEGARTHLLFAEGVADGTDQPILHIIGSAGVFAAAVDTGANTTSDADGVRMIAGPSSTMQMHYPRQPSAPSGRGGDWYMRSLASGGAANAWGAEQLLAPFNTDRYKFTQLAHVFNAHADMRMVGWEGAQDALDASAFPGKRGYAWGDSGFIGQAQPTAAAPAAWAGEGHWLDPSDLSSVFEDVDGLTPASVDGLVRRIDDKSGNGHHFILEGSEPGRLRLDDGIYWIDVGDEISPTCSYAATAYAAVASNAYWMAVAARDWQSAAQATDVAIMDDGTGGDRVCRLVRGANMQPQPIAYSSTGTSVNLGTGVTNSIRHNDDFILAAHVNGTAGTGYWNQAELGTATVGSAPDTGASVQRVGAAGALGATTYLRGRFYGLIQRAGNIALDQRTADMAYLRSRMPR